MIWFFTQIYHLIRVIQIFKLLEFLPIPLQIAIMLNKMPLMILNSFPIQGNVLQSEIFHLKRTIIKNLQKYTHNYLLTLCVWSKVLGIMNCSIEEMRNYQKSTISNKTLKIKKHGDNHHHRASKSLKYSINLTRFWSTASKIMIVLKYKQMNLSKIPFSL